MGDGDRSDPRRGERKSVDIECEVIRTDTDEPIFCRGTDLSHSGIWLQTEELLRPGEQLVITFRPPDWPSPFSITVFGQVARVSPGRRVSDRGLTGMGVEFADLSEAEREALDACIQGLPAPEPQRTPKK
ncbi:MAG: PilZ domain-containing protein [Deltaproteobacteria bacterium]|jgi:hypothetical protein|nr:PilZ domain-containing protein [Deltaproteobacteria bacterium]MBW2530347.1 PilZ domain-containing protein [Deltaproteobacteria bacterium]